jgi:hypothetical protein
MSLHRECQSIYSTHKREHSSAVGEGEARTLAGDEILPILCYVIAHADVICLGVLVELMMGVCDPTVLNGESGYYLTVLSASLTVIPFAVATPFTSVAHCRLVIICWPAVVPAQHYS